MTSSLRWNSWKPLRSEPELPRDPMTRRVEEVHRGISRDAPTLQILFTATLSLGIASSLSGPGPFLP